MVWSGILTAPAVVGDRLAISVDFTAHLPDVGGRWVMGARLGDNNFGDSNSLPSYGSASAEGWQDQAGRKQEEPGWLVLSRLRFRQVRARA